MFQTNAILRDFSHPLDEKLETKGGLFFNHAIILNSNTETACVYMGLDFTSLAIFWENKSNFNFSIDHL